MEPSQLRRFRRRLLGWYATTRRDLPWRHFHDPYAIWVSEVMLQQTQVKTVIPYFERFMRRYPDVAALARADLQDVLKSWEKLGYYARARNLHSAAQELVSAHGGILPQDPAELRKLPGIGEYMSAAISSIAFGGAHAVVDGNVRRVLSRLFTIEAPINSTAAARACRAHAEAILDSRRPGDFNQATMELGATVCLPREPQCDVCPISLFCGAKAAGQQHAFPVRGKRKSIPTYHVAVGIVRRRGRILITRRTPSGLLGGLWEFPGGRVAEGESPEEACRREIREETDLEVEVTGFVTHVDHAYSHFKIGMDVYSCVYRAGTVTLRGPVDHRWILVDEIADYPFPGANHKFLPVVIKQLKRNR
jgi:A/G-specific adenine glycosylase